ncbi:hypothetical protein E2C01_097776 [Portunus trituberculatus]|uniref:Uncharacterized protein n=1 Tax=Portunus trituberculatus TaxID=210409 RepID=A0A5B7KAY1_PORTR|nr:hypothetical protein [Portunus trituberculatus]
MDLSNSELFHLITKHDKLNLSPCFPPPGVDNEEQLVSWHLEAPSNIVPDSTRGWITAVGDLLGPTLDVGPLDVCWGVHCRFFSLQ